MSVHRERIPLGNVSTPKPKPITPEELVVKFQKAVLSWFEINGRDFPWRRAANPFHLIVAESLLRQTQAERVVEPYLEFISTFPNAQSLANASVNNLRLWFKPLGLFNRADCLIETARLILTKHSGRARRMGSGEPIALLLPITPPLPPASS